MKYIHLTLIICVVSFGKIQAQSFLDTTFNQTGILKTDTGSCEKICVIENKKFLTLGEFMREGISSYILKWNEDGSIDLNFVNNLSNHPYMNNLHDVVLSSTGTHYFVCGESIVWGSPTGTDFILYRLFSNGTLDSSFGTNGAVITNLAHFNPVYGVWFTEPQDFARSIALQDPDKIIVSGESDGELALVRYTAEGKVDSTFGTFGITTPPRGYDVHTNDIEILPDHRIVVGFGASIGGLKAMCVMRFLPDGAVDSSFNQTGLAYISDGWLTKCNALSLQPDGKVLLAGYSDSALIVRFDTTGSLDSSFGNEGICKLPPATIRDMVLTPDGKILVTGTCDDNFVIYRCYENGTLDTTFGNKGIIQTNIEDEKEDRAYSIAMQEDGKILVGGNSYFANLPYKRDEFVLARYLPDETSGIQQITSNKKGFLIYPNPVNDVINIVCTVMNQAVDIKIMDIMGHTFILHKEQMLSAIPIQIDVSSLASGIYFLNAQSANGIRKRQKFIKK